MERVYDMPLPHNAPVLYGGQFQVHLQAQGLFVCALTCSFITLVC